ncbi:hypothetical protein [Cellulomonas marina]|uniref:Uncharacterized protein n=1 Tax=Cellulomonas marina TaxID=988821 RepID=A0A1I0ZB18_9CELL|nr:hypothetical protein [Cellulomonas marina]GIG28992.1 hypothetical protein Cma02nite_15920 [Cellulomonas marina]SFB22557.1 hypothetical protein SAMN05421867_11081 [Cellulomonas marina]
MPYTARKPPLPETPEQLRARIPGWGVDLDPRDRPAFPREVPDEAVIAADALPEAQPEDRPRERSIEHMRLTPVFGTAQPLHGVSGAVRRLAYARFSEARAAHWLLLLAGDRIESAGAHVTALLQGKPDDLLRETGVLGEVGAHPVRSRTGEHRADLAHAPLDPLVVVGPWLVPAALAVLGVRAVLRRARR